MMAWWKRFGRRAATLLLTVLMLLGAAAGEGTGKTVINRINAPDVSADFAFAEDTDLLEIIFPQILDCDAAFLRCGGETMLIDCATSGQARRILNMFKQLGITHVDKIVNTHPHADHIGGFAELIKEITVDELWLCFPAEETVHCANAIKAAERAGVTVRMFGDGDTLTLGTATMQVWMLDKPEYTRLNDRSAQIMLTFGQRKMLFAADLEQKGQNGLIAKVGAEMLKADVLKYPQKPRPLIHTDKRERAGGETFGTVNEAFASDFARVPRCPVCGKKMKLEDGAYVRQAADKYISIAKCPQHGNMLIRVRLRLESDGQKRLTMTAAPSSMTRFVATMHLLDSVVMIRTGEDMECRQSSICSAALLSETMAQMKGCLGIGGTRQG